MRASEAEGRYYTHPSHEEGQAVILRMYDGYPFSLLGYASNNSFPSLWGRVKSDRENLIGRIQNSKFILLLKLKNIFISLWFRKLLPLWAGCLTNLSKNFDKCDIFIKFTETNALNYEIRKVYYFYFAWFVCLLGSRRRHLCKLLDKPRRRC